MCNGTVAAGERLGERLTVNAVRDCLTDSRELRRTEVAAVAQLTVAGAAVVDRGELAVAGVDQLERFLGRVAAGDAHQDIHAARLQVLQLCLRDDLLVNDLLDGRLCVLEVALVVGVLLQNGGLGAGVIALHHVRTGVGVLGGVGILGGSLDVRSHGVAVAALGVEVVGQVNAVAVVLDLGIAQPHLGVLRGETGVGHVIEVGDVVAGDREGELVIAQQADAGEFLLALCGAGTGVRGEILVADQRQTGAVVLAGSLSRDRRGERQQVGEVVLGSDSGAVAELQVVVQLDLKGLGAVRIQRLGVRLDNGSVPDVVALLVGDDSAQLAGQVLHVQVSGTGAACTEDGVAEGAGQLSGVTDDDILLGLAGRPVDQCACNGPEGVGRMILDGADRGVVHIVVLVGVQGHLGHQLVPSLDVVLPPLGKRLLLLGFAAAAAVVDHCHAQEVETEDVLLAVLLDVVIAVIVLLDIGDGDFLAVQVIEGDVVPVLTVGQSFHVDVVQGTVVFGGLVAAGCRRSTGPRPSPVTLCCLAGGGKGEDHQNCHQKGDDSDFLHGVFLRLIFRGPLPVPRAVNIGRALRRSRRIPACRALLP